MTVSFDANGGSGVVPASEQTSCGAAAGSPTTNPSRAGYTFAGWYTNATGGTKWDFGTPVTSNLTLYAHWTSEALPSSSSTTPAPAGPPAKPGPGSTTLASTGVDAWGLAGAGALIASLGVGLVIAGQRRRYRRSH
ncbi:hypothetical protein GTY80_10740 [Amycolatopsis sp. SID8362]|nr:hypothetical protein [Amycolatopsis sp. SID8362]NED40416.1 InlB B-repeat-containing protein [Amycolatopsis sp. SID8362]